MSSGWFYLDQPVLSVTLEGACLASSFPLSSNWSYIYILNFDPLFLSPHQPPTYSGFPLTLSPMKFFFIFSPKIFHVTSKFTCCQMLFINRGSTLTSSLISEGVLETPHESHRIWYLISFPHFHWYYLLSHLTLWPAQQSDFPCSTLFLLFIICHYTPLIPFLSSQYIPHKPCSIDVVISNYPPGFAHGRELFKAFAAQWFKLWASRRARLCF